MKSHDFKIISLYLENYKKYTSLKLDFHNRFSLVIGDNGSGKTTVLDALATLLGGFLQAFQDISSSERHSIMKKDIKLDILDKEDNLYVDYRCPVRVEGVCHIDGALVDIKRVRNKVNNKRTYLPKKRNQDLFNIVSELEKKEQGTVLPVISYYGNGRVWEQAFKASSKMENITRYDGYKDCLNARSNYRNFISWFEKLERNAFNIRKDIPVLEAVRNTVMKMLSLLTKREVELFIYRESDLEVKFKDSDNREKVSHLSDGYRNVIGLVSDIAYRMAILNPDLGLDVVERTPGVVLIDEIDLHLHPKWQREIVFILQSLFPRVQFIATSHSPFIIQTQTRNSIILLEKDSEFLSLDATTLSIEDISESIQKVELPQISKRKKAMLDAAEKYFDILDKIEEGELSQEEEKHFKTELDQLTEPYEDNMAYVAFLRRKRLLVDNNEAG